MKHFQFSSIITLSQDLMYFFSIFRHMSLLFNRKFWDIFQGLQIIQEEKDDETFKHNYIHSAFHQTSHHQTTIPFSCSQKTFFCFRLNHCSLFLFWRIAWLSKVTIYTLFKLVKAQYFPGVRWIGKFINFNTQHAKRTP